MNILFFAPVATKQNPSFCPFITQRVFELQKRGHNVVVIQCGKINFINNFFKTKRRGFFKILSYLYHLIMFPFFLFKTIFFHPYEIYTSSSGSYKYYDSITFFNDKYFYHWYKKNKFDLISAHFLLFAEQLPRLKKIYNIPYTITCHGGDVHEIPFIDISKQKIYAEILNNSSHSIFISDFLRKKAIEFGFNNKNYSIIYNGVDPNKFFLKNNLDKNNNFPVLGFSGHTIKVKRVEILPQVLYNIKKVYPNASLLIVGGENSSDDLIPFLKEEIKRLGLEDSTTFTGIVLPEEVPIFMRKMDVLLFPSRNEGFGCVAIEAQFCGVPVVGSSNGGIPEAVFTGICVPESDNFIEEYSNSVIKYLKNPIDSNIIKDRVKSFTWENCIEKEISIFRKIINT